MAKEIKVRIYLKDSALKGLNKAHFERPDIGRIFDVKRIDFESRTVTVRTPSELDFGFDDVELMQFTGLRDKNGKKIFEGDIVKVSNLMGYEDGNHVVVMKNGCFRAGKIIGKDLEYCEIIGNIYENP